MCQTHVIGRAPTLGCPRESVGRSTLDTSPRRLEQRIAGLATLVGGLGVGGDPDHLVGIDVLRVLGTARSHRAQETGWTRDAIVGAFSLSLLVAGAASAPVGMLIDRFGGRVVMSLGSLVGAAVLMLMSEARSVAVFYGAWTVLGVAAARLPYEPAFAVIYASFESNARKAITALTLVAGFASTVFWPLTQALVSGLGWRHTLLVLGIMNLAICLPLHAALLPSRGAQWRGGSAGRISDLVFGRCLRPGSLGAPRGEHRLGVCVRRGSDTKVKTASVATWRPRCRRGPAALRTCRT
jgi:hypothetical protein